MMGGLMGVTISWPAANNGAIQSDLFPKHLHACSFSVQFFFEGFFSSLSPLFVGTLNDLLFNGKDISPPGGTLEWDTYPKERKEELLGSLANSIIFVCTLFWTLCALTQYPIYYYYPLESIELKGES
jgi:hypothetical protein